MKALFLDRDGVINRRIVGGYVSTPDEFVLLEAIIPILQLAHDRRYKLILATNQQGVGKGLMTKVQLNAVHDYMNSVIMSKLGFIISDIRVCTSLASENDPRRKPGSGMLDEVVAEYGLNPSDCWFIGDSLTDVEAGIGAGVKTALVGLHDSSDADVSAHSLELILPVLEGVL